MRWKISNEARSAELALIIPYLTSESGKIVLFKTPTKYREFYIFEQTRTVTICGEHS